MKTIYKIFIIILLMNFNVGFSQDGIRGRITYTVSLNIPKERLDDYEKSNKDKGVSSEAIAILKNSKNVNSILEFSMGESNYYVLDELDNDSSKNEIVNFVKTRAGGSKVYYTENNTNSIDIFEQDCKLGDCFLIENEIFDWKLTKETKKINIYTCYKAIINYKNKDIIFWYTPEIPTRFGPKNFSGLPGAILEIQEGYFSYSAINIELNLKSDELSIEKPKGELVTKDAYDKMLKKAFPEFFDKN
ncbi:MAG: GLPGLI family protein [Winogradskyella sp.]|uniref:GLPGLI family protein n=1 Tax=Winogradskyella sp. TaxID=1883156 RepID=UPI00385F96AD